MTCSSSFRTASLALALSAFACGGEGTTSAGASVQDREAFIATYVDLRTAVIRGESHVLSDADRATILAEHGMTEEDLTRFAEVHGEDLNFMRGVWDDVEERLDGIPVDASTGRVG